jgi:hypothetical protein
MDVRVITMCKFKEVYERFNNLVIALDKLSDAPASIAPPVPEADTSAMLLTGLVVMGFMVRRRKNTQA